MLLAFRAENARSFRQPMELSLHATALAQPEVVRSIPWRTAGELLDVLPAAGVLGANASGKSNLLLVMDDMRRIVLSSFRYGTSDTPISRVPFLLSSSSRLEPTRYEVDVVIEGIRHEYGFVCDDDAIQREWAYHYPRGRRKLLFERTGMKAVRIGDEDASTGRETKRLLRANALLSSTGAATDYSPAVRIFRWMSANLLLAEAQNREVRHALTVAMLEEDKYRQRCLQLLRAADLGIVNARLRQPDDDLSQRYEQAIRLLNDVSPEDETFEVPPLVEIELFHQSNEGPVPFGNFDESLGTVVWLGLIGPVIRTLIDGSVLLLDELDSSLHPGLVRELIRLFQDPETNPHRAQVIFNAFDMSVLSQRRTKRLLGRDQIWFTEKDEDGGTRLYPLTDFAPRKDEAIDDRYLRGRYGAVPLVSEAEFDAAVDLEPV